MGVFRHANDGPYAGQVEVTGRIQVDRPQSVKLVEATRDAWLPKSKIKIIAQGDDGTASVLMPPWLAREKGYIS